MCALTRTQDVRVLRGPLMRDSPRQAEIACTAFEPADFERSLYYCNWCTGAVHRYAKCCALHDRRKIGCLHSEVRRKLFLYAENNVAGTLNNLPQSTALCRVCDFQTCVGRHDSIFFTANEHGAGIRTGDYLVPGLNFLPADGWLADRKSPRLNSR